MHQLRPAVLSGEMAKMGVDLLKALPPHIVLPALFTAVYCAGAQATRALPDKVVRMLSSGEYNGVCSAFTRGLTCNFANLQQRELRGARVLLAFNTAGSEANQAASLLRVQVLTHAVTVALAAPGSWFGALLTRSLTEQRASFVPSMPEDEVRGRRRSRTSCRCPFRRAVCRAPWRSVWEARGCHRRRRASLATRREEPSCRSIYRS